MRKLEQEINDWHSKRFGNNVKISAVYRKLVEEVGEVGQALIDKNYDELNDEISDVITVLTVLLGLTTKKSIKEVVKKKFSEVKIR